MSQQAAAAAGTFVPMTAGERRVIIASSLGTVFEWYDFYLYGSLAVFISRHFFAGVNETTSFIFALLAFAAGFVVRPFGAVFFGRFGDMVGRKHTFMLTILLMGVSTFLVGLLPGYATLGVLAPVLLISLRLLQGLALGGEYGGAATYVAEHAPADKRGSWTSWIQTTATLGLFLSLVVILGTRTLLGEARFEAWGWRIPFLLSVVLLGISVWIRLALQETPAFQRMKSQGRTSRAPLTESFGRWSNLKGVLLALLGIVAGQAVVWYCSQFYALFFLTQTLKVDLTTAHLMVGAALLIGTPFFIVFGSLSDRIGRKPIIMAGCLLAALAYFPLFKALTHYANPALTRAMERSPIVVHADPAECSFQFNPTGTATFTSSCDVVKSALVKAGVAYQNVTSPPGATARVLVGETLIESFDAAAPGAEARLGAFEGQLAAALEEAGYPAHADPDAINVPMVVAILTLLVLFVTMVYGPIAAMLVELFPTRIRYTSMSLPYHLGNGWFGGFLPTFAFAMVAANGDIYYGLWYPVVIATMSLVIGGLFLRETRHVDIYAND